MVWFRGLFSLAHAVHDLISSTYILVNTCSVGKIVMAAADDGEEESIYARSLSGALVNTVSLIPRSTIVPLNIDNLVPPLYRLYFAAASRALPSATSASPSCPYLHARGRVICFAHPPSRCRCEAHAGAGQTLMCFGQVTSIQDPQYLVLKKY